MGKIREGREFPVVAVQFKKLPGPGGVAQLVRALSPYVKVMSSIPIQGTLKNQPMNT